MRSGLIHYALVVAEGLTPDLDQRESDLTAGVLVGLRWRSLEHNLDEGPNAKGVDLLGGVNNIEPGTSSPVFNVKEAT